MECCRDDYVSEFGGKKAQRAVSVFRRRGLRGTARLTADLIRQSQPPDSTLLEVGGGAGLVGVALLESGSAASVVNIDLSPEWDEAASDLVSSLGLLGRVRRIFGDFVAISPELDDSDVVILHRVICCYPDWRAMADASVSKARRAVAVTLPRDVRWNHLLLALSNLVRRLRGSTFRAYVHPTEEVVQRIESAGFRASIDRRGLIWRTLLLERIG